MTLDTAPLGRIPDPVDDDEDDEEHPRVPPRRGAPCEVRDCNEWALGSPCICANHRQKFQASPEWTRYFYWSKRIGTNKTEQERRCRSAADTALVDWLSRVESEARNGK